MSETHERGCPCRGCCQRRHPSNSHFRTAVAETLAALEAELRKSAAQAETRTGGER